MSKKLRVVLDTNVIVRAVSGRSMASIIFDALFKQEYILCVSTDILLEYEEKLAEIYDQEVAELVMSSLVLLPNIEQTTIFFDLRLIAQDADDDKFVNCVFAANADHLISDDRHFRSLIKIPFPRISCLSYDEFKLLLSTVE